MPDDANRPIDAAEVAAQFEPARLAEAARLLTATGPIELVLQDGHVALALLSHLQLALRHPRNRGPSAELAERMARSIEAQLAAAVPSLAPILAAGWDPAHDHDADHLAPDLRGAFKEWD